MGPHWPAAGLILLGYQGFAEGTGPPGAAVIQYQPAVRSQRKSDLLQCRPLHFVHVNTLSRWPLVYVKGAKPPQIMSLYLKHSQPVCFLQELSKDKKGHSASFAKFLLVLLDPDLQRLRYWACCRACFQWGCEATCALVCCLVGRTRIHLAWTGLQYARGLISCWLGPEHRLSGGKVLAAAPVTLVNRSCSRQPLSSTRAKTICYTCPNPGLRGLWTRFFGLE